MPSGLTTPLSSGNRSPLRRWFDDRTGVDSLLRAALEEPIPGGARWAYIFGSGLLFLFVSQLLTGVALALYYVPAANDAHVTVTYIVKVVSAGSFLRSLHSYGASAFIVVLLLHIIQTFFYGSYKGRRELVWISGCILFALMLGMAFTGYLLPWDEKAYFATAVGTNVMGEMPMAGNVLKLLLRGGGPMGTVTLSRFFVLHVLVLPGMIAVLIVAHLFLFRKVGPAGPIEEDSLHPRLPTETFYPRQFGRDVLFAALLLTALAWLSYRFPVGLGPEANPSDTTFLPRPEWYFLPLFEWLKFWPGKSALIGVAVLPAIVTFLFLAAPFLDRSLQRHPLHRPFAIGGFCLVLGGMVGFGALSRVEDRRDPVVTAQITKQKRAEQAFMSAPFAPQNIGGTAAPAPVAAPAPLAPDKTPAGSPRGGGRSAAGRPLVTPGQKPSVRPTTVGSGSLVAQGKVLFSSYMCNGCHGDNGEGTDDAPDLIGTRLTGDQISSFLQNPDAAASTKGMPNIPATSPDLQALVAYVLSIKRSR